MDNIKRIIYLILDEIIKFFENINFEISLFFMYHSWEDIIHMIALLIVNAFVFYFHFIIYCGKFLYTFVYFFFFFPKNIYDYDGVLNILAYPTAERFFRPTIDFVMSLPFEDYFILEVIKVFALFFIHILYFVTVDMIMFFHFIYAWLYYFVYLCIRFYSRPPSF